MVGRLDDHGAGGVVAGPPGPPGDLVELPGVEQPAAGAVVLRQRREHDGADRHVDAHPEGVGAADDLQQPGLGELFDQAAVLGQHPGVVHPDAVAHQPRQRRAECGGEPEPADQFGDRRLLLLAAHIDAHQGLGPLQGGLLGEVHDVDRGLFGLEQFGDRLVHRRRCIRVVQRHRAFGARDQSGGPPGPPGEILAQERHVPEGGRHQQELGPGQLQQRHLPGPAAVGVAVEVELVHHHQADIGGCAFRAALAQGDVGQHLGGAGDDRRGGVDRCVTGQHADVGRAEHRAQREELLADQRLDRCGVVAARPGGQGGVLRAGGHQRLPGAGRGGQDDVGAAEQFNQRLLLRRVQRRAARVCPGGEAGEQLIGIGGLGAQRRQVGGILDQGRGGGAHRCRAGLTRAADSAGPAPIAVAGRWPSRGPTATGAGRRSTPVAERGSAGRGARPRTSGGHRDGRPRPPRA